MFAKREARRAPRIPAEPGRLPRRRAGGWGRPPPEEPAGIGQL